MNLKHVKASCLEENHQLFTNPGNHAGAGLQPTTAAGLRFFEQGLEFLHDFGVRGVEVLGFAGVGVEVVELARGTGRGVGDHKWLQTGITVVTVSAGARGGEKPPRAAADGECARTAEGLREQIGADGDVVLTALGGQQVEAVFGGAEVGQRRDGVCGINRQQKKG